MNTIKIKEVIHKRRGKIQADQNQFFRPYLRIDGSLQRVELLEWREGRLSRVMTYLAVSIINLHP